MKFNYFFVLFGCCSGGKKLPLIFSFVLYGCGSGSLKPPLIYSVVFSGGFEPPQMFWNTFLAV
jgi:hypothetical protein